MKYCTSDNVPGSTYFRVGDVEPIIDDDSLIIYNGTGTHRSWGSPGVTSTVVIDEHDFLVVHVGFYHKHGGGQTWRYYTLDKGIKRVGWRELTDEVRQIILDAERPRWARTPGKLRSGYRVPQPRTMTTYKAVRTEGDRMWSLYDGETEYVMGRRLSQAVGKDAGDNWGYIRHDGGYYSHPSIERVKELLECDNLVPDKCLCGVERLAILECEASGRIVEFPNGKLASTYLKPVKIVLEVIPAEEN